MKETMSKLAGAALTLVVAITAGGVTPQTVYAKDTEYTPEATTYLFDKDGKYVKDDASDTDPSGVSPIGLLSVLGNIKIDGTEGGYDKINTSDDAIEISYQFDSDDLPTDESSWYLVSDKTDTINGYDLSGDIKQGAILVETSYDGATWVKSGEALDYFSAEQTDPVYMINELQLLNGCYVRVTVAYKEEQVAGSKKVALWSRDVKETRKIAEVYTFYIVDEEAKEADGTSPSDMPHQQFDDTDYVVSTGNDTLGRGNGYSTSKTIDKDDVHYGWSIGTFTVNGFTKKQTDDDGNYVFLKNAGDRVTLWFTLNQDINKLNGKDSLSINDDKNGQDELLQTSKSDAGMGRGTLFIRYTSSDGSKPRTETYVDYLAACSTTSADTRVVLYEEGDYEIVLDYEIRSTPRSIAGVDVVPEVYNYRVSFEFSVHNSNTMLFPFDTVTGSELINNAITPNGFRIDLANSKDLEVNVERVAIKTNSNGKHIEDVRENKAAKDGATYTAEGMYRITVKNTFTEQETPKTLYVGTDPFLKAMANTGWSVEKLDEMLSEGYTLADDGSLVAPSDPSDETEQMIAEATETVAAQQEADLAELNGGATETEVVTEATVDDVTAEESDAIVDDAPVENVEAVTEESRKGSAFPAIIAVIVAIVVAVVVVVLKNKAGNKNVANMRRTPGGPLPNRRSEADNLIIDVAAYDASEDTSDEDSWNDDTSDEEGEY